MDQRTGIAQIALPDRICGPVGERADRVCRVVAVVLREHRCAAGHEDIGHVPALAIAVDHAGGGIGAHDRAAGVVGGLVGRAVVGALARIAAPSPPGPSPWQSPRGARSGTPTSSVHCRGSRRSSASAAGRAGPCRLDRGRDSNPRSCRSCHGWKTEGLPDRSPRWPFSTARPISACPSAPGGLDRTRVGLPQAH